MSEYAITLSGPRVSESQARNALAAEQFDVHTTDHDYGLPPHTEGQAESFVNVTGSDVDKAWDAVRPLGWRLRLHHLTVPAAPPSVEQALAEKFGHYDNELVRLKAEIASLKGSPPPIAGAAVESPPWAEQNTTMGAEQFRRGTCSLLQRGASIGSITGGLVGSGDCTLTPPGSGMSVNVAPGEVWVAGSSAATQSGYLGRVSSSTNLAVAASDPTSPRIDRVSAIVTDSAYSGGTNTFTVAVETGVATAGATLVNLNGVAAAPASSLTLGYVLVPATSVNVTGGNISNVAALVSSGVVALTGTDASKPVATQAALREYLASDTGAIYQSNGSAWIESALYASGTDAGKPAAGAAKGYFYYATDSNAYYWSDGTTWRTIYGSRGATNIATSQSTSSTSYTTLATPDQVTNVVLPTNGKIIVGYQATWQESVNGAAHADIFIGSNEIVSASQALTGPSTLPAGLGVGANKAQPLSTYPLGLAGSQSGVSSAAYTGDVSTGQVIGGPSTPGSTLNTQVGGPCEIFAAAGTYTVSVRYTASSGSVTASNRKLWVEARPFG